MYRFNKLLVAVDFSSTDHAVLAYASHISRLAGSSRIYFAHVAENFELPEKIREKYPALAEPLDEFALKRMKELTEQFFTDQDRLDLVYEVSEGEQISNLLRLIKIKDIDLVLVGKSGDDALGEKLARKAPCSVLIIPDGTQPFYHQVTVAADFSNHSLDALDVARAFSSSAGLKSFNTLHVYDVPSGYYKTGKTFEQFAEIMKNNATQQFVAMMKQLDMKDINPDLELVLDKKPTRAIEQYADISGTDLLILAARGREKGAGILLGSVTEQVIRQAKIPVLAVKKKGAGMDIVDAILNS